MLPNNTGHPSVQPSGYHLWCSGVQAVLGHSRTPTSTPTLATSLPSHWNLLDSPRERGLEVKRAGGCEQSSCSNISYTPLFSMQPWSTEDRMAWIYICQQRISLDKRTLVSITITLYFRAATDNLTCIPTISFKAGLVSPFVLVSVVLSPFLSSPILILSSSPLFLSLPYDLLQTPFHILLSRLLMFSPKPHLSPPPPFF